MRTRKPKGAATNYPTPSGWILKVTRPLAAWSNVIQTTRIPWLPGAHRFTPRLPGRAIASTGEWQEGRPLYEPTGKTGNNPHLVTAPFGYPPTPSPRSNDAPKNLWSIITPYTGRNWLVAITRRFTPHATKRQPNKPRARGYIRVLDDPRGRTSPGSRARAGCPGMWPGNLPVLALAVAEATAEAAADLPTDSVLHVRLKGNPTCEPKELSGGIKTRGI